MKVILLACIVVSCWFNSLMAQTETLSLKGVWRFAMDSKDVGINEKWFSKKLEETINLPASMPEQNKGEAPSLKTKWTGSIYDSSWFFNPKMEKYRKALKFPFWLTPTKYYVGAAWYQKDVEITKAWKKKRIVLFLERPHWEVSVWIDGKYVGKQNSLSVAHQFDITEAISVGKHTITLRIDNRSKEVNVGQDSHSITDHTQGNWNGVVGEMNLHSTSQLFIDDLQTYPDVKTKTVKVVVSLKNKGKKTSGKINLFAESFNTSKSEKIKPATFTFKADTGTTVVENVYAMGEQIQLWDEFSPVLYRLTASLSDKTSKEVVFGFRDFKAEDGRFAVNGKLTFMRGTVENCQFPLTGYPSMNEKDWTRIFQICKSYGLNHMRFHSYCPPEAAFIAADKLGFYLQPEGPSWANHGTSLGDGKPIDKYIYEESARIMKEYGNHPSFCMYAYGNEPKGNYVPYLDKFVDYWREKDNRRLYTGSSTGGGWKTITHSDFFVRATPRGLNWKRQPESNFDYREKLENQTKPYISHEVGQYCVFPNFKEIPKYTGHLKAKNFEMFQEDLTDKNMGDQANDFLMASGKLQTICYKEEIEAALRTPKFAGFQLLGLNDYSGQGTALVGLLDAFWDEKGYVDSKEFNHFCNSTVPLIRTSKFIYKNNESLNADVEVAHFGAKPIENAVITWKLTDEKGTVIAKNTLPNKTIEIGNCISLGSIDFKLNTITKAGKFNLEVSIDKYSNNWNFWVYPAELPKIDSTKIYFCNELDTKALEVLKKGGKVFMNAANKVENGKEIVQTLTPVFWNTSWFKMRPPHVTGHLIQATHPIFNNFPTDYYTNIQYWELVNKQLVMNIDSFPANFRPLIQPIDTWFVNRRLAILFEAEVEKGKLIVCSSDLSSDLENRPVAKQLLYSIVTYMQSDKFVPKNKVNFAVVAELFEKKQRETFKLYTKDAPDEIKQEKKK